MFKRTLLKVGILAVAGGGFFLYSQYDRAANYEQTVARVTGVDEVCYMKKVDRGIASKTTSTTKEGPCEVVSMINKSHPEFQDYDLIKVTYVEYEYQSPADGKWHTAKRKQTTHKNGTPVRFGDEMVILAHRHDPERTQRN